MSRTKSRATSGSRIGVRGERVAVVVLFLAIGSCGKDSSTTVVDDDPASLDVSPDTLRLASPGDTATISATVRTAGGSVLSGVSVTYQTGDSDVATVNPSSGLVTAEGEGATTITAQAGGGSNPSTTVRVEVGGSLAPAYLVGGNVGVAYSDGIGAAMGAGGAFDYDVTAGGLPDGLSLDATTAEITGVPTTAGVYFFEVSATNGVFTVSERYAITISTRPPSAFNLWIAYNGGPMPPLNARNALNAALARWEEIVTGDAGGAVTYPASGLDPDDCQLVDASLLNGAFVEDVAILMSIDSIDGLNDTLAQGGPCGYGRDAPPAAITGQMLLDEADASLASTAFLRDVFWHEIAHALHLGTIWQQLTQFEGTDSVRYYGAIGNDEWRDLGGPADGVPVEPDVEGHWDEGWFNAEIMTPTAEGPFASHPISRVTIGALRDLGFDADLDEADSYTLPLCRPNCAPARVDGARRVSDVVIGRLRPLPR